VFVTYLACVVKGQATHLDSRLLPYRNYTKKRNNVVHEKKTKEKEEEKRTVQKRDR